MFDFFDRLERQLEPGWVTAIASLFFGFVFLIPICSPFLIMQKDTLAPYLGMQPNSIVIACVAAWVFMGGLCVGWIMDSSRPALIRVLPPVMVAGAVYLVCRIIAASGQPLLGLAMFKNIAFVVIVVLLGWVVLYALSRTVARVHQGVSNARAAAAGFPVWAWVGVAILAVVLLGGKTKHDVQPSGSYQVTGADRISARFLGVRTDTLVATPQLSGGSADRALAEAQAADKEAILAGSNGSDGAWQKAVWAWRLAAQALQAQGRPDDGTWAMNRAQYWDDKTYNSAVPSQVATGEWQQQGGSAGGGGEHDRIDGWVQRENELARQYRAAGDEVRAEEHARNAADYQSGAVNPFGNAMQPMSNEAEVNEDIRGFVAPPSQEAAASQLPYR